MHRTIEERHPILTFGFLMNTHKQAWAPQNVGVNINTSNIVKYTYAKYYNVWIVIIHELMHAIYDIRLSLK